MPKNVSKSETEKEGTKVVENLLPEGHVPRSIPDLALSTRGYLSQEGTERGSRF